MSEELEVTQAALYAMSSETKPVELEDQTGHIMSYKSAKETGGLPASICTCGKSKRNLKLKVLQNWSYNHYRRTGHLPIRNGRM